MVTKIVGTFLYYSLVVDYTMLVALGNLTSNQSNATEKTYDNIVWLINDAASHPTEVVRYKQINMTLQVHSDTS